MNRKLLRILCLALCGVLTGVGVCACTPAGPGTADTDAPTQPAGSTPGTDPKTEPETEPETEAPAALLTPYQVADLLRAGHNQTPVAEHDVCGLSDPSAVGLNEAELNTVLYPAPADDTCRNIVHVADYGITPENEDNSRAFDRMMTDLADSVGRVKIIFKPETYRFSSTIKVSARSRICFCSEEAGKPYTFLMTEWTPGIRVTDSSDIQFVDMALDYEIPSAVSGVIVSAADKSVVIRVDDAFDLTNRHYNGGTVNYGSYMEYKLDEQTGEYAPDPAGNLLYNSTGDGIRNIVTGKYNADKHELTLTFKNSIKKPAEGTHVNVAYTMYDNCGIDFASCKNVKLESVHVYHTTGMAIAVTNTENVYLNRVFLSPRENSPMLMTATADCFHCISCTGEIVVTSSRFELSHDDSMNINSRFLSVTSNKGDTITVESMIVPVNVGDELELLSKDDLHVVGAVTVKAVKGNTLTCDGVTEDMKNCFAGNITNNAMLTVRNCFFGNKRNRGMLIQVRHVLIENCVFRNIVHGPIQVLCVPSSFGEGICPVDVTIRNNKFIGCGGTDINVFSWAANGKKAAGVIRDVTVTNNYFNRSIYYPVQISTGGNVTVDHNLLDNVCTDPSSFQTRAMIRVTESCDVKVTDNVAVTMQKKFTLVNDRELARDKQSTNVVFENNIELD